MPLFEYSCKECTTQFETLVRAASDTPECPSCHSTSLQRRQSTFAAHTNGTPVRMSGGAGACGSCGDPRGPGACSIE